MTMLSEPLTPAPRVRLSRVRAIAKSLALVTIALWRAWKNRREVNDLLRLDDRMLKDIGLARSDVLGALAEPIGADPSIGLRLRSVENQLRQRHRADQLRPRDVPRPARRQPEVKEAA